METANLYDRVRSFDFAEIWDFPDPKDTSENPAPTHKTGFDLEGERACYVEGVVLAIIEPGETGPCGYKSMDCTRVCILVDREVRKGEETLLTVEALGRNYLPKFVYPPQNDVESWLGSVCCGIEVIDAYDRDLLEDC
jgi:hypothetical protein